MKSFRPLACCMAGLALAASSAPAQHVHDSAGLRVVHYPRNATAPARWSIDPTPVRTIGGAESVGAAEFSGLVGIVRMSNGDVAVADRGAAQVRLFDALGNFKRDIGRKGRGPGEYDGIFSLVRIADTLVVADFQGRAVVFGPDGSLKRTLPRPILPNARTSIFTGALQDGSILYAASPGSMAPTPGTNLLHINIYALKSPESAPVLAIASTPTFEIVTTGGLPRPLTLGAMGRMTTAGTRFCSTFTKTWEVTCYGGPGQPTFRTVRDVPELRLPESDKETWRTRFRITNRKQPRDSVETWLSRTTFSDYRSTIGRIVLSPSGELWASDYDVTEVIEFGRPGLGTSDNTVPWHVLGPDGRWVADIVMPPRFRLVEVTDAYVTGIQRDADDLENVVVYRLNKQRGQ